MKNIDSKKQITVIVTAVIAILLAAAVVFFDFFKSDTVTAKTGYAMGSEIKIQLYGKEKNDVFTSVFSSINKAETKLLSRKKNTSEIYSLNKNKTAFLSDEAVKIIVQALDISKNTYGAFDITLGNLTSLWNFDGENKTVPKKSQIDKILSFCGGDKLTVSGNTVTLGENQTLDLGAFGKGYACDIAVQELQNSNAKRALISVGGTVATYGKGKFTIGIKKPDYTQADAFLKITLGGGKFISTSGNYEKFFEQNGKVYHHILNPENGYPAESGLKSVTVITENGALSDALSTACFVLGKDKSKTVLAHYSAEALFVDNNNNVYITDGIKQNCTLLDSSYKITDYE